MNPEPRLIALARELKAAGVEFLVMGGHAVRYYGISRNTLDFDFHISTSSALDLVKRLQRTDLLRLASAREGPSWRPKDFRRFQIGTLADGREEWLEFWIRNHLLDSFDALYARREEQNLEGFGVPYLSLPDLIRSKETERDDDWADHRLLEEILDARNISNLTVFGAAKVISQLRSRRGFGIAQDRALFSDLACCCQALETATHPVSIAYLLPFCPAGKPEGVDPAATAALRQAQPGSARHLALVETVRLAYQRAAKMADRRDKERRSPGGLTR